jgi:hypothetical protein
MVGAKDKILANVVEGADDVTLEDLQARLKNFLLMLVT